MSLTVVIPAYNEEQRIEVTLTETIAFLNEKQQKDRSFTYEVIVVDDCSVDRTVDVVLDAVKRYSIDHIRLLELQHNHGKGGAIRKGVMRARGEFVLFADADNATEIRDYDKLARVLEDVKAVDRMELWCVAVAPIWKNRRLPSVTRYETCSCTGST